MNNSTISVNKALHNMPGSAIRIWGDPAGGGGTFAINNRTISGNSGGEAVSVLARTLS